jgi:hypothetical protein
VDFNDPLKIGIGEICSGYFSFKLVAEVRPRLAQSEYPSPLRTFETSSVATEAIVGYVAKGLKKTL